MVHVDRRIGRGGFRQHFVSTHNYRITVTGSLRGLSKSRASSGRRATVSIKVTAIGRGAQNTAGRWPTDWPDWFVNRSKVIGKQNAILCGGDISYDEGRGGGGGPVAHAC